MSAVTIFDALYGPDGEETFRDNPLVEALPPLRTAAEMSGAFGVFPDFHPSQRELPASERLLRISRLRSYLEPLVTHEPVCNVIHTMVRAGYANRNPVTEDAARDEVQFYRNAMKGIIGPIGRSECSTAASMAVLGGSGVGKTTIVKRALNFLPQVLRHRGLNLTQIVWLRVDCPPDGSPKGLMLNLLAAIDALVDSDYYGRHRKEGIDKLIGAVAAAATRHRVGLIVIDEIQRLLRAKGTAAATLLSFFVSLANEVQVPILYVGTRTARNIVVTRTFDAIRRFGENGIIELSPLARDAAWDQVLTSLFDYQWTRECVDIDAPGSADLRAELSDAFYHETQGILALVVRLYQTVQVEAIESGSERITAKLVHDVARTRFSLVRPVIDALRDRKRVERHDEFFDVMLAGTDARIQREFDRRVFDPGEGAPEAPSDDGPRSEAVRLLSDLYSETEVVKIVDHVASASPGLDAATIIGRATDILSRGQDKRSNVGKTLRKLRQASDEVGGGVEAFLDAVTADGAPNRRGAAK